MNKFLKNNQSIKKVTKYNLIFKIAKFIIKSFVLFIIFIIFIK